LRDIVSQTIWVLGDCADIIHQIPIVPKLPKKTIGNSRSRNCSTDKTSEQQHPQIFNFQDLGAMLFVPVLDTIKVKWLLTDDYVDSSIQQLSRCTKE
jgi:hypothetical protein